MIRSGDDWLRAELPRIISWANLHSGVIFLTWDEGDSTNKMPFLAVGPGVFLSVNRLLTPCPAGIDGGRAAPYPVVISADCKTNAVAKR